MNNSEPDKLIIDRFPDGTVLIADIVASRLDISLFHPNKTMKFMNNINQSCSTNSCHIDQIMPYKQNSILITYQTNNESFLYQYNVMIVDWSENIILREILFNESELQLDSRHYRFIKNTFYEDKYLFILFKNNYVSYIEYNIK